MQSKQEQEMLEKHEYPLVHNSKGLLIYHELSSLVTIKQKTILR